MKKQIETLREIETRIRNIEQNWEEKARKFLVQLSELLKKRDIK
jgi:hypothetical protein